MQTCVCVVSLLALVTCHAAVRLGLISQEMHAILPKCTS